MAIGKVYDSSEVGRIDDFMQAKISSLDTASKTQDSKNKSIIKYSLLLVGAIVTLLSIKLLIRKK
jgi:uncharacterized membrane protein